VRFLLTTLDLRKSRGIGCDVFLHWRSWSTVIDKDNSIGHYALGLGSHPFPNHCCFLSSTYSADLSLPLDFRCFDHRVHTEWRLPISGVHTSHGDGKNSPGWWEWGCPTNPFRPITKIPSRIKLQLRSSWEGRYTPCISSLPYMYSRVSTVLGWCLSFYYVSGLPMQSGRRCGHSLPATVPARTTVLLIENRKE
jgi:hypothetical protein